MGRIKYFLSLTFLLVLLISIAYAQSSFHLDIFLWIDVNDNVKLLNMSMVSGPEMEIFYPEGNYTLQILSKNKEILYQKNFNVEFVILSNPPVFTNETTIMFSIPLLPNIETLKVLKNGKVIFEERIGNLLCNQNGKCEDGENFYSCPKDCPSGSKDNVCDALIDEKCDPDCQKDVDLDCNTELKEKVLKKGGLNIPVFVIISIIAILMIVVIILLKVKTRSEQKQQFNF
jgi:heme/copper-type cytochrome/quinol oxidase subunit 4